MHIGHLLLYTCTRLDYVHTQHTLNTHSLLTMNTLNTHSNTQTDRHIHLGTVEFVVCWSVLSVSTYYTLCVHVYK